MTSAGDREVTPPFRVRPLTADDGMTMATWRYPGPWSIYDSTAAPQADEGFWAVEDATETLVGFCCLGAEARVPGQVEEPGTLDVGVGMDPELTGRGYGGELARVVVAHARSLAPGARLRCVIQEWNARSLAVARASGFVDVGHHDVDTGSAQTRYIVLAQ